MKEKRRKERKRNKKSTFQKKHFCNLRCGKTILGGGAKKISALARFAHYGDIMRGKCRMSLICKGGHTNIHDIRNVS